jgi:hypothetical protein
MRADSEEPFVDSHPVKVLPPDYVIGAKPPKNGF